MVSELLRALPLIRLRESTYDRVYLSPHLDDAVYSCAGRIAQARGAGERVLLVTLFGSGGQPHGRGIFEDYVQRTREERAAAEALDVDALFLDAPELTKRRSSARSLGAYALPFVRLPANALRAELHAALSVLIDRLLAPTGELYAPLAIGCHPDHREVYEVGRALHAELGERVLFYEDLPYATLTAMREERLSALGLPVAISTPLHEEARIVTRLLAAEQPPLARGVTYATLLAQRTGARALFGALGSRDAIAQRLRLETHDISAVVDQKVAAMHAYETQTAYFFPEANALPAALPQEGGRYVERVWRLARADEPSPAVPTGLRTTFEERLSNLLAAR
jgi:LmbE family N-acetylglucosaminyl deacetylase